MADLHRLAPSRGPLATTVIFVHGLGGHPFRTWQATANDASLWPRWLAEEIGGLAVWSVGYEAPVSRWRGHAMHLVDRAENILGRLLTQAEMRTGRIVLVGHSLGGLVIKQVFRLLDMEAKNDSVAASLLDRIDKVAFLATPHTGSGLADTGDRLRILVRPSAATLSLVRNDPNLRELNVWYRQWATERGLVHLVLRETKPIRILGTIVQPDSADPALPRVRAWPADKDHLSIAKPSDRADEVYAHIKGFVAETFERPVPEIVEKADRLIDGQTALKADTQSIIHILEQGRQSPDISVVFDSDAVRIDCPGAHQAHRPATLDLPWRPLADAVQPDDINLLDALRWNFGLAETLHGRDDDLNRILAWAERTPTVPSARLVTGEGGSGKTRLAATAARRLSERGWIAGFVRPGSSVRIAVGGSRGLLLILDYPEENLDLTRRIIQALAATPTAPYPIRVLLLSRRDFGHWESETLLLEGRFGRHPVAAPSELSADQAATVIREAARTFADHAKRPVPSLDGAAAWAARSPLHRLPLFAIAAAVHAVLAPGEAFGIEGGAVIRDLAERERLRVRRTSERLGIGTATLGQLLALGVLADGLSIDAIEALVDEGLGDGVSKAEVVRAIAGTPWWRSGRLIRLQPDRVAAAFLGATLFDPRFPQGDRRLPGWVSTALIGSEREFGNRLGRILFDFDAPGVARAGAAPLEKVLTAMIEGEPTRAIRFAGVAQSEVPYAAAAFAASVALVLAHLAADDPEHSVVFLNNAAGYLSVTGRREEALKAAQEAAGLYRELAEARPEAFTPDLAGSLNNLANGLSDLGRREEALEAAEEAVAIRRRLAEARPEAFTPDLAVSLNNLANRLSDLGRREEALEAAQEAVAIRRRLAEARPEAFTPDLAVSLNNLANGLSDLGRREEALEIAQEAVVLYRRLAEARPEAFTPNLAVSLNNLANRLSDLGRREEALETAQEAAVLYRRLAEARPEAFTPDLAGSLNNLANGLSDLGRREEALEAAQEAVAIRRRLAEARPEAFTPDLAGSLNNLANRLSDLGRREEALETAQEAVALFFPLANARPEAFATNLFVVLTNLARQFSELGRNADADEVRKTIRTLFGPRDEA